MKNRNTQFIVLAVLSACATKVIQKNVPAPSATSAGPVASRSVPPVVTDEPTVILAPVGASTPERPVSLPTMPSVSPSPARKMPSYVLSQKSVPKVYSEAIELLQRWGNSDEFFAFFKAKRTYFAHYAGTVDAAIEKFRNCLDQGGTITLQFYDPIIPSRAYGGWNGSVIMQNLEHSYLTKAERAEHLYHETSHKCGFIHKGNRPDWYDNENSFPYASGYDFEDFLNLKLKQPSVAGE
jgi:hypothetical protein